MSELTKSQLGSVEVGRAALRIAITASRAEENIVKDELAAKGIKATAVDFGGEFINSIVKGRRQKKELYFLFLETLF